MASNTSAHTILFPSIFCFFPSRFWLVNLLNITTPEIDRPSQNLIPPLTAWERRKCRLFLSYFVRHIILLGERKIWPPPLTDEIRKYEKSCNYSTPLPAKKVVGQINSPNQSSETETRRCCQFSTESETTSKYASKIALEESGRIQIGWSRHILSCPSTTTRHFPNFHFSKGVRSRNLVWE